MKVKNLILYLMQYNAEAEVEVGGFGGSTENGSWIEDERAISELSYYGESKEKANVVVIFPKF